MTFLFYIKKLLYSNPSPPTQEDDIDNDIVILKEYFKGGNAVSIEGLGGPVQVY